MAGVPAKRPRRNRRRSFLVRALKRVAKWAVVCTVLWLALGAALASWARTPMAREYAGRQAAEALHRELGLVASIDEVDLDIDKLAVVARGIRLDHPEHGRFADAERLRIRPSWLSILRGSLDLEAITIKRATLWLKVRDQRILNLPELPDRETDSDELELPFRWFIVRDSRLVVDAQPLANGELGNIDIELNASDADLLRVRVKADHGFVNHEKGSDSLDRVELVGGLRREQLDIDLLRLDTPDLKVGVFGAHAALPLGERYSGHATLDLDLAQLARAPLDADLSELSGRLVVDAKIAGNTAGPSGKAKVVLHRTRIEQFMVADRFAAEVDFDPEHVSVAGTAEVVHDGGSVDIDAKVGLGDGLPIDLHADIHDVSFAKLMAQLGVSDDAIVDWNLAGTWDLKGRGDPLSVSGPLRMDTRDFKVTQDAWHVQPESHVIAVESARLDGSVTIDPDGLLLKDIAIALPDSRLKATVLLGFDNALRGHAQGLDWALADSSPLLDFSLGGRGRFDLEIDGTFSDPTIYGSIDVADFAFSDFVFGQIKTDFAIDDDMMGVRFARIDAAKHESRYALLDGFLDFRNDGFRAGGDLELERMHLADFYHIFGYQGDQRYEPYQAVVKGATRVDYSMGHPSDGPNGTMQATMDLEVPQAEISGYGFTDGDFAGSFTWYDHTLGYRGAQLLIDRLSMRKGRGTVNISGKMAREGILDLVAVGDKIAIRDTEGLGDRLTGVSGSYSVTARIEGSAALPRAHLDVNGTGLSFNGEQLGDGRAYVRLTDKSDPWIAQALKWQPGKPPEDADCGHARQGFAHGRWPPDPPLQTSEGPQPALDVPMAWIFCGDMLGGRLDVDMAIGRTEDMPLRGRVTADDVDLQKLLPRNPQRKPLSGMVSGHVHFTGGAMKQPETLAGRALLSTVRVGQLDIELMNSGPVDVTFGGGGFEVARAEFIGPSSQLYIRGGGSARRGLALSIDGSIDLGLLSHFSQTVTDAMGTVTLGFKVSGPMQRPAVYGKAAVRDAALAVASFPMAVSNVNGNVTFSQHRVLFEDFQANLAGGRLSWRGAATLTGQSVGAYEFSISADRIGISPRDGIDLRLGGAAELTWKEGDRLPLLGGKLRVDAFEYTRQITMGRTFEDMYQSQRTDVESYDPDDDTLAIDLRVVQTQPFYIRNNLIDAELTLQTDKRPFRLVGTDQRFGITGNMAVKKGAIRFRDTNFAIRQGDISFDDETRIDPLFDLRATTDVRRVSDQSSWHVQMHAYGRRDEFQFELSSDPYLTEDDIALLLTVGMTHSELAQLETGDLTSTAALEALATVTGVEREVHRALPQIDDIRIASSYSERSNRTEPQLFIGKRIADNVRLSASTGIAESRDFSTGVELQLNDQTSVEAVYNNQNASSTSQVGDVGVDLKWRLEFD